MFRKIPIFDHAMGYDSFDKKTLTRPTRTMIISTYSIAEIVPFREAKANVGEWAAENIDGSVIWFTHRSTGECCPWNVDTLLESLES